MASFDFDLKKAGDKLAEYVLDVYEVDGHTIRECVRAAKYIDELLSLARRIEKAFRTTRVLTIDEVMNLEADDYVWLEADTLTACHARVDGFWQKDGEKYAIVFETNYSYQQRHLSDYMKTWKVYNAKPRKENEHD